MKQRAYHKLSYGLYLVASEFEGQKVGYIANTVFQVTSKPPLLAISCHKDNSSTEIIKKAGAFSVSVLGKNLDVRIIGDFGFKSGKDIDKFGNITITRSKTDVPIVLNGSVAWFDCVIRDMKDMGSHWLIFGEVIENELLSEEEPLTYALYREKYRMLSPKHSPTHIEPEALEEELNQQKQKEKEAAGIQDKTDSGIRICQICGYTYDPEIGEPSLGIPPGIPFEDLPDDFQCPVCSAPKEYFK